MSDRSELINELGKSEAPGVDVGGGHTGPVAPVPPPPASDVVRPHVTALDGVRGIAIGIVVLHHLRLPHIRGGWIGVDLFFVLSGFLITTTVVAQEGKAMRAFLVRRFWRLAPALTVLLGWFAVASLDASDRRLRFEALVASAGQVINVTEAGSRNGPFSAYLGHLWSLSAEVQFYLVWPLLLAWLLRRRASRGAVLAGVAGAWLASAIMRWVLVEGGMQWNRMYFAPDTRSAGLMAGCVVGLLFAWGAFGRSPVLAPVARLLAAPSLLAVLAYTWFGPHFTDHDVYTWQITTLTGAGAVLVAAGAVARGGLVRPLLELRPLVWIGQASFSLYLWHVPVIAVVLARWPSISTAGKVAVVVPVTLLLTWASLEFVERPLMSATRRKAILRRIRPARAPLG